MALVLETRVETAASLKEALWTTKNNLLKNKTYLKALIYI